MDGRAAVHLILTLLGAALMALVLLDVFLTVLYARVGVSVFSNRLARLTWRTLRLLAAPFAPRRRATIESFSGPVMLLVLVTVWSLGLAAGAGMVFQPKMGTAIRTSNGPTPTDFSAATYAGASSMSIVGAGDFSPKTPAFRCLFMFNSLVSMCMISLTLTYFMQIYSALQKRNSAALQAHLATAETGDAAELVAGLGPRGDFNNATSRLSDLAAAMADVKETHHFYSLLMYCRFREPYYAVARYTLIMLDTVSLIETALDEREYASLKESGSLDGLWRASLRLLTGVGPALFPGDPPPDRVEPDEPTRQRWHRRYAAALRRLRGAGIKTVDDEDAGASAYVSLRSRWDQHIRAYGGFMDYDMRDIDPVGVNPDEQPGSVSDAEPFAPFRRLRSAG